MLLPLEILLYIVDFCPIQIQLKMTHVSKFFHASLKRQPLIAITKFTGTNAYSFTKCTDMNFVITTKNNIQFFDSKGELKTKPHQYKGKYLTCAKVNGKTIRLPVAFRLRNRRIGIDTLHLFIKNHTNHFSLPVWTLNNHITSEVIVTPDKFILMWHIATIVKEKIVHCYPLSAYQCMYFTIILCEEYYHVLSNTKVYIVEY